MRLPTPTTSMRAPAVLTVLLLVATLLGFAPQATAQEDVTRLVTSGASTSGFFLDGNSRQWVNPACRQELEAAGHLFAPTPWNQYGDRPVATTKRTCTEIGAAMPLPSPASSGQRLVTSWASTSGFFLDGNSRQWVNPACRQELEAAGHAFQPTPWNQYGDLPVATTKRTCTEIGGLLDTTPGTPPPDDEPAFASVAEVDGKLFLITAGAATGERQNVERCRTDLNQAGVSATPETWTWLGRFPDRTERLSCDQVLAATQSPEVPRLVSRLTPSYADIIDAAMSHDGNIVGFTTADRIVADDFDNNVDVHVLDRTTGVTKRVAAGTGLDTSFSIAVSGDGRWVFFAGRDPTVTPQRVIALLAARTDTGQTTPLMPVPFTTNTNSLRWLSTDYAGSVVALISPRGFDSDDRNTLDDAYLVDRVTGSVTLLSADAAGNTGNGETVHIDVSGNGRWVVFVTDASNLLGSSSVRPPGAYRYEVDSGELSPVAGAGFEASHGWITVSSDGTTVAYSESSSPFRTTSSFVGVIASDLGGVETSAFRPASLSGDGRWLVATDPFSGGRAVLVDRSTGDTYEIDRDFGANSRGGGVFTLSADGRFLLVETTSSWVDGTPATFDTNLFMFDLRAPGSPLAG